MNRSDLKIIKADNSEMELFQKTPLRYVTKAKLIRSVKQDDYVDVIVESSHALGLNLEDRIILDGEDYFLNFTPIARKNSKRNFVYDMRFEGAIYTLRKYQVFNRDSQNRKTDYNFNLTADLAGFIDLILINANHYVSWWVAGTVPSGTIMKTLYFNNQNCLSALHDICEAYDVEFYVNKNGLNYEINIGNAGQLRAYTFEYGKGKGLYSLERKVVSDTEVVTRLYGFGGTENLPIGYRGYSRMLRMPASDYVEDQLMIDLFGFVEKVHESTIKPEFVGQVSYVGSLTAKTLLFRSTDMDFDLAEEDGSGNTKWLLDGQKAIVHFLDGKLAGYEFDVYSYDHGSKEFQIDRYTDEGGVIFPDGSTFAATVGDRFTITNIMMPPTYVANAEAALQAETEEEYLKLSKTNIKDTLNVDPLFMRSKPIDLGDEVGVSDMDLGVNRDIRILSFEYDILLDKYIFDLSDVYEVSLAKRIVTVLHGQKKAYKKYTDRDQRDAEKDRINLRDLEDQLFDGGDTIVERNFGEESISIKILKKDARPQTMGAEGIVYTLNDGGDENAIALSAGGFTNFAINELAISTWNMASATATGLNPANSYYIYAKTERNGTGGTWLVTTNEIQITDDPDYYHFLTGLVYKPVSGKRLMDLIHGAEPKLTSGKPVIQYEDGPATEIIIGIVIPGLQAMAEIEQAAHVNAYRNGAKMRLTSVGVKAFNFYIDVNGGGEDVVIPKVPLTGNERIELNLYK